MTIPDTLDDRFLDAYLDGELGPEEAAEIELRLRNDAQLRQRVAFEQALRSNLKECCADDLAPDHLRRRILGSIATEPEPTTPWRPSTPLMLTGASVLVIALATAGWVYRVNVTPNIASSSVLPLAAPSDPPPNQALEDATEHVVGASVQWHHQRLPLEVTGPDMTTVSHWFRDKVDFTVQPPALRDDVSLLGGRLAHVQGRDAAYLTFEYQQRKLSMMIFRSRGLMPVVDTTRVKLHNHGGYNVAIINDGDLTYSLTTDLPAHHIHQLIHTNFQHASTMH